MTLMYRSRKSFYSSSFCTEVWSRATIINLIPGSTDLSTTQSNLLPEKTELSRKQDSNRTLKLFAKNMDKM